MTTGVMPQLILQSCILRSWMIEQHVIIVSQLDGVVFGFILIHLISGRRKHPIPLIHLTKPGSDPGQGKRSSLSLTNTDA